MLKCKLAWLAHEEPVITCFPVVIGSPASVDPAAEDTKPPPGQRSRFTPSKALDKIMTDDSKGSTPFDRTDPMLGVAICTMGHDGFQVRTRYVMCEEFIIRWAGYD